MKRSICLLLTLLLCVSLCSCNKENMGELPKLSEDEIEKVEFDEEKYRKDCEEWETKYKEAMTIPSDFEGGSGESADRALRSTKLQEERIAELRKFRELKLKEKKYTYIIDKGFVEDDPAE